MMKTVFVLAAILSLAHHAFAQSCTSIPQYNETFVPDCAGNDVYVLWPSYQNFSQYYRCQGAGNPVLANCAVNTYFSYYLQICTSCADYLPAPACTYLKTQNQPKCVAVNTPTVKPTTTTTTQAPTTTTTTKAPVTAPTRTPVITTTTTKAAVTTTTVSGVPQPPSPSTVDPNIPTPPTPAPTPPTVAPNPPSEAPPA